jgi:hypothetical protein
MYLCNPFDFGPAFGASAVQPDLVSNKPILPSSSFTTMNYKNRIAKSVNPPYIMTENHIVSNLTVANIAKNCKKMTKTAEIEEALRPAQHDKKTPLPLGRGREWAGWGKKFNFARLNAPK